MKPRKRSLESFIRMHRSELKSYIKSRSGWAMKDIDSEEIRGWILNDEGLYNWARSCGVEI